MKKWILMGMIVTCWSCKGASLDDSLLKAQQHLQNGQIEKATAILTPLRDQYSEDPPLALHEALCIWAGMKESWEESLHHCRSTIQKSPQNSEAHFWLAETYRAARKPEYAVYHLQEHLKQPNPKALAWLRLAQIAMLENKPMEAKTIIENGVLAAKSQKDAPTLEALQKLQTRVNSWIEENKKNSKKPSDL